MKWKFAIAMLLVAAPLHAAGLATLRARKPDLSIPSKKALFALE